MIDRLLTPRSTFSPSSWAVRPPRLLIEPDLFAEGAAVSVAASGWIVEPRLICEQHFFATVRTSNVTHRLAEGFEDVLRQAFDAPRSPAFTPEVEARAEKLLLRSLTPAQRESYRLHGHFEVIGSESGHPYSICKGRQLNVTNLASRRNLCLVFPSVPLADQLVGQKILLEGDEPTFLRDANG